MKINCIIINNFYLCHVVVLVSMFEKENKLVGYPLYGRLEKRSEQEDNYSSPH